MYIQLTTRCNMTCQHCCFAANRTGEDMSLETFVQAIEMASARGDYVTLGGGEPTVHPRFNDMLDFAIRSVERGRLEGPLLVITNGKLVTKARRLLDMCDSGEYPLCVELSQDRYHDPIREEILTRFQAAHDARKARHRFGGGHDDGRGAGIRTVSRILPVGRGAELSEAEEGEDLCACEDLCVDPSGLIYSCGCKTHLVGHVSEGADPFCHFDWETAHRDGGGMRIRAVDEFRNELLQAA